MSFAKKRPASMAVGDGEGAVTAQAIESLRKRMESALVQQQTSPDSISSNTPPTQEPIALRRNNLSRQGHSANGEVQGSTSTDSLSTIRGDQNEIPDAVRTPSYPFPRMGLMPRGPSQLSGPRHKPFTLLSPTNVPNLRRPSAENLAYALTPATAQPSTPWGGDAPPDDPNDPLPNLYDLILLLNAEAGIDAWWLNVTEILSQVYGAERASLAIPGDMTDLENVPWGQKASFSVYGLDCSDSSNMDSAAASDPAGPSEGDFSRGELTPSMTVTRPLLETRHSIAGMVPDSLAKNSIRKSVGPIRAISGRNELAANEAHKAVEASVQQRNALESLIRPAETLRYSSDSASQGTKAIVHNGLHALESELDPLIVRTGVTALFGKRKPVIMTRAVVESSVAPNTPKLRKDSKGESTNSKAPQLKKRPQPRTQESSSKLASRVRLSQNYEEFEQPEPTPWSKSPRPSPAIRLETSESPFFNRSAKVDEAAFEPNQSAGGYSTEQPVEAIGMDGSKTLIHIPLIQPASYHRPSLSNLTFPTAIISLLIPHVPYPLTLRHSLAMLLPHLASSYSMAVKFTGMEAQVHGRRSYRMSRGLGLGGTFSDESSELELAAELRGQISTESRLSSRDSVRSPSERSATSRGSPLEAPSIESANIGFAPTLPITPGRGAEIVDGYFSAKRSKNTGISRTPGAASSSKSRQGAADEGLKSKRPRPVSTSNSSSKIRTLSKRAGNSNPSSPRLENTPEVFADENPPDPENEPPTRQQSITLEGPEKSLPDTVSQLLLNSVPLQLFLAKPRTGELIWTNSKFDAFRTQAQAQAVRTKDPWQNVHEADRLSLAKDWKTVLKTGAQMTHPIRVKRFSNDSDYRWFIFRANPLLNHHGQLMYWIGSFLDIHDQREAEMKAAEDRDLMLRNAKYQALANSIPQVLFEAVENVGIVSANEQWLTFSGQPLDDALRLGFTKHVHPDDLKKCGILTAARSGGRSETASESSGSSERTATLHGPESPADALSLTSLVQKGILTIEQDENGRISYSTEIRLRSRGGEYRWFLVRLVKVESDLLNGGKASWYGTCTDINDRRRLERELNRANQRIKQDLVSKTKFFANMSHEIRTPLNGILGSIPWLAESLLQPDQRRTLDTIQNSSSNLRELVDNILDVTKMEAGKMRLSPKWFQLRTVLEEVIDTVASRAVEKGLELNYTIDTDVPQTVQSDPFRLRQILINLMGNAIKFTATGEIYTRCFLGDQTGTDEHSINIAFEVIDTGKGLQESDLRRLFQQFGQIESVTSHDAGSGLGLFLSKQLVELLGGQLSATSQTDHGSTFSFFLRVVIHPDAVPESPPVQRRTSELSASTPSVALGPEGVFPAAKGILRSPGRGFVSSPDTQSPDVTSSSDSNPSLRSTSHTDRSSISSRSTPEYGRMERVSSKTSERHDAVERALEASRLQRTQSKEDEPKSGSGSSLHPTTYSIVVICPAQYARAAIKQHIGQVIPHHIAANIIGLGTVEEFLELATSPSPPVFTHVVLDIPDSDDVSVFMQQMQDLSATINPALVIISDHYQKRDVADDHASLTKAGRTAYMVHKPIKPSVFALIFDPSQQRNLSIDRNRGMAQSVAEDFKNVAERVRNSLGGKGHRVLLVEDSDTNRLVILRYLNKVDLLSEYATNGQECLDMIMRKQPGYYSLIICDIQMPIKNGYDACRELRDYEASHNLAATPMMALTANAMPEERAVAREAGFTDYLTKPVEFSRLGEMMVRLLGEGDIGGGGGG